MKAMSNVIRILFATTAVVTITVLFPPRQQMPAQMFCLGDRCVVLHAFHRCDENPDPCSCMVCEIGREDCCFKLPPVSNKEPEPT